jgi:hypothetical protein
VSLANYYGEGREGGERARVEWRLGKGGRREGKGRMEISQQLVGISWVVGPANEIIVS